MQTWFLILTCNCLVSCSRVQRVDIGKLHLTSVSNRSDIHSGSDDLSDDMNKQTTLDFSDADINHMDALHAMSAQSDADLIKGLQTQTNSSGPSFFGNIAIIGAGPVGLYLANRLVRKGFDVKVLEAYSKPIGPTGSRFYEKSEYFVRDQVLLINEEKYQSITNLERVLTPNGRTKLRESICGTDALPPAVYNMNCANLERTSTAALVERTYFSIPIRVLQVLLYENLLEISDQPTRDGGRNGNADVIFTNRGPSWVDHKGRVGFFRNEWNERKADTNIGIGSRVEVHYSGAWLRATVLGIKSDGRYQVQCDVDREGRTTTTARVRKISADDEAAAREVVRKYSGDKDELTEEQFARCYFGEIARDGAHMTQEQASAFFRFFGIKRGGKFTFHHWVQLEQSVLITEESSRSATYWTQCRARDFDCLTKKPTTLVCADGANGGCSTMVLSGTKQQPIQKESPNVFESYAMLFLLRDVPEELRSASNRGELKGRPWPAGQNRFRIFTARQPEESWYVAATLTKREYEWYKFICTRVVDANGIKHGCPGINELWGTQDLSIKYVASATIEFGNVNEQKMIKDAKDWLCQLFYNALNFASIPKIYHETLLKGAAVSAFPITLTQAVQFMKIERTPGGPQLRAAVGDAAASVHFFSGSGVNIGLKSAELFAELYFRNENSRHPHPFFDFVVEQAAHFKVSGDSRFTQVEEAKRYCPTTLQYNNVLYRPQLRMPEIYESLYNSLILYEHLLPSYGVIHQPDYPRNGVKQTYGSYCGTKFEYLITLGAGHDHRPTQHSQWFVCPPTTEEAVKAVAMRLEIHAAGPRNSQSKARELLKRATSGTVCGHKLAWHAKKIKTEYPNMVDVLDAAKAAHDHDTICALYEAFDDDQMHQCRPDPFSDMSVNHVNCTGSAPYFLSVT